jgi:uncharacterized membrane protein
MRVLRYGAADGGQSALTVRANRRLSMAGVDVIMPVAASADLPVVRRIMVKDLAVVLKKGLADFWAMPTHVVFLCLIYPVAGIILSRLAFGYDIVPLLYPLAAGFAILGPFAAVGLYELSRRRELGLDTSWRHAFDVVHSPSFKSLLALGGLLLVVFLVWIAVARSLYIASFGYAEPENWLVFLEKVLTTSEGRMLALTGNFVGFLFALFALMVSVVSFPLLLDRNVSPAVAIMTSVRAVLVNPLAMAVWGIIVAVLLAAGFALLFFGLAIIVPVLGHATWHLYRAVIVPDDAARPEYHQRDRGIHYGADFPASLFMGYRDRK